MLNRYVDFVNSINQAKMATVSSISEDKIAYLEDDIKINYCTSGNGDHPVLLLPGALGMSRRILASQIFK